jgi:opacity protein-like surface antigen
MRSQHFFRQCNIWQIHSRRIYPALKLKNESRRTVGETTMRLTLRFFATAAVAVMLMPTSQFRAQDTATPAPGAKSAWPVPSSELPTAPTPEVSRTPVTPHAIGKKPAVPKVELFLGYSYLRAMPELASGNRLVYLNGGSTNVAFNLNRYLGLVGDFGGFNDTRLLLTGAGLNPSVNAQVVGGSVFSYFAGPRLSFRDHGRLTPFAQVLVGGMHASDITLSGCTSNCTFLPAENTFAMTAGGGLDLKVRRHLSIRIVQAEYLMTSFESRNTGGSATQNDLRLSSGIVLRFGGRAAPRIPEVAAVTYSCAVNPSTVFPGDAVVVSGTALNLAPSKTASYTWSVSGGTVEGVTNTAHIDTVNLAPGTYTVKGHVSQGNKPAENADSSAQYVVKAFEAPTVSCSVAPVTAVSGNPATITAIGVSPQNRPLTYRFSATSGSFSGTGPTAVLSTAGAAVGPIAVTCNVLDDKGQPASSMTSLTVVALPSVSKPMTSDLCTLHFDRDVRRPARVDNEGKACLDQVALSLQQSSDSTLAIVGNAGKEEVRNNSLASERAVNTRAYLVREKGIDSSRITVYTGSLSEKTVSTTLIPPDAIFDAKGDTPIDQNSLRVNHGTSTQPITK